MKIFRFKVVGPPGLPDFTLFIGIGFSSRWKTIFFKQKNRLPIKIRSLFYLRGVFWMKLELISKKKSNRVNESCKRRGSPRLRSRRSPAAELRADVLSVLRKDRAEKSVRRTSIGWWNRPKMWIALINCELLFISCELRSTFWFSCGQAKKCGGWLLFSKNECPKGVFFEMCKQGWHYSGCIKSF